MDLFSQFTREPDARDRRRSPTAPTAAATPADAAAASELPRPPVRLRRRTSHEHPSTSIAEPSRRWPPLVAGRPGRLRRDLAMDDLPDRGPAGLQPAAPLQGPLAVRLASPQAPEGTLVQTDPTGRPLQVGILEAMPGPGRHFYSPLEYETELVKDDGHPARQARRRRLQDRQAAARRAPTWSTTRATAASCRKVLTPGPLPDQQVRLRRQDRRRRRLRRAQHAGQAQGRATRR